MWFDPEVVRAAADASPEWLVLTLAVLSFLGSLFVVAPVAAWWYVRGDRERTGPWFAGMLAIYGAMTASKAFSPVDRPAVEPPIAVAEVPLALQPLYAHAALIDTASFPSGHALAALAFWGLIAIDADVGTRPARLAAAAGVVVVVSASRIVLGAHYVGDVVGGLVVGAVVLGAILALRGRLRDPTAGLFAVAGALATLAILAGNVRAFAVLGAAVGALAAWRLTDGATELPEGYRTLARQRLATVGGCGLFVALSATGAALTGHPLALAPLAAAAAALVVAAPVLADTHGSIRPPAIAKLGTTASDGRNE